jgi:hypothetical protein
MFATALNNIGVGLIVVGIVAPMVNGTAGGWRHFGAWSFAGAVFFMLAQLLLGRLRP